MYTASLEAPMREVLMCLMNYMTKHSRTPQLSIDGRACDSEDTEVCTLLMAHCVRRRFDGMGMLVTTQQDAARHSTIVDPVSMSAQQRIHKATLRSTSAIHVRC